MGEGKKGAATGVGGGDGGAAIATTEGSPELPNRALRCKVFKSDGMGMKRRERRPRPCHFRGQGKSRMALAMAGRGESSRELTKLALETTTHQIEGTERERGTR
jgi:hypothetical protein